MAISYVKRVTTKAKKKYTCEACGDPIARGDDFENITWRDCGQFRAQKLCTKCAKVVDEYVEQHKCEEYTYALVKEWWFSTKCKKCKNLCFDCKHKDNPTGCINSSPSKCNFLMRGACSGGDGEKCKRFKKSIRCENYKKR